MRKNSIDITDCKTAEQCLVKLQDPQIYSSAMALLCSLCEKELQMEENYLESCDHICCNSCYDKYGSGSKKVKCKKCLKYELYYTCYLMHLP